MYRFFIAAYDEDSLMDFNMGHYRGLVPSSHETNRTRPPAIAYYRSERERDTELVAYCRKWPGIRFVTGEFTAGQLATIGPVEKFTVSDKGVLPA